MPIYIKSSTRSKQIAFFIILFFPAHYFILRNVILLSNDLLYGDFSGENTAPVALYEFYRVPNTALAQSSNAHDRLAGDFAQVYFPSQKIDQLKKNYMLGGFDPWNRPSRYAPLVHYLCAISYCKLDYGPASLIHIYFQLFLFYAVFVFSFFTLNIPNHLPFGILLLNAGLFLTPAGLSWFERGQFSLYVALGYLFVSLGMLKMKPVFLLLGALCAFIKWTSLPAIFVMLSVFTLASANFKELKTRVLLMVPFFIGMFLLLAVFPTDGYYFLQGLYLQETFEIPQGVSLVMLLPVEYVKFMPLVLIGFGMFHIRKFRDKPEEYLPFHIGVCILMLIYPTVAYEYNLPALLCFIPFSMCWADLPGAPARERIKHIFFLFLLYVSYFSSSSIFDETEFVIYAYVFVALFFLIAPLSPSRFPSQESQLETA